VFVPITNTPRPYAWGSYSAIADFRGMPPSGEPEAELWLGAHPGSPSRIIGSDGGATSGSGTTSDGGTTLDSLIAANPEAMLGSTLADGGRLPFLLKVLAANQPLSLQVHPHATGARAGFKRENAAGIPLSAFNRNYADPYPKPELIVAVSDSFLALSGFRPLEEVIGVLANLRTADAASPAPEPATLDLLTSHLTGPDPLRTVVEWLLRDGRGDGRSNVSRVVTRVTELAVFGTPKYSPYAPSFALVGELAASYPGDPGIVISLLLNPVELRRGESLFLDAGNIHAYIRGLGIELMTASDNVLRGGLTPKHIDVSELLAVLDTSPVPPPLLAPVEAAPGVLVYDPGQPDFLLYRIEPRDASAQRSAAPPLTRTPAAVSLRGPAIILAEGDGVHVAGATGDCDLDRGAAAFVTPDEQTLTFTGPGIAWAATVGT